MIDKFIRNKETGTKARVLSEPFCSETEMNGDDYNHIHEVMVQIGGNIQPMMLTDLRSRWEIDPEMERYPS